MSTTKGVPLPLHTAQAVRQLINSEGERVAAELLGLSRMTTIRAAGRFCVTAATTEQIYDKLAALADQ